MKSTRYSCQISVKLEFSEQVFEKYSNVKFHENPSGRNRVLCAQTDMTKLIIAFRTSANAPKNIKILASFREPTIVIFRGLCCSMDTLCGGGLAVRVRVRGGSCCDVLMKVFMLVDVLKRSWVGIA